MNKTKLGLCHLQFYLPGVASLKEKRSIIKSMLARTRNKFNVSAAEVDHLDRWQSAAVAIAAVSNSSEHIHQTLQHVITWIEDNYPDALITEQHIEMR